MNNKQKGKNKILIGLSLIGFMVVGLIVSNNIKNVRASSMQAQIIASVPIEQSIFLNFSGFYLVGWEEAPGGVIRDYYYELFDQSGSLLYRGVIDVFEKCNGQINPNYICKVLNNNEVYVSIYSDMLVENQSYSINIYSILGSQRSEEYLTVSAIAKKFNPEGNQEELQFEENQGDYTETINEINEQEIETELSFFERMIYAIRDLPILKEIINFILGLIRR